LAISSRLPSRQQAAQVYAVIVLLLYGWMMWWFLFRFTTWRLYLTAWEIGGVLAFSIVTAFLESILVALVLLAITFCLPRSWIRDSFVARGAMLAGATLLYMMYLDDQFKHEMLFPGLPKPLWLLALPLAAVPIVTYASGRIPWLRRLVESFADRATVFLYLLVPLSALSVLVLVVRLVTARLGS
jgi:hypothetical protein